MNLAPTLAALVELNVTDARLRNLPLDYLHLLPDFSQPDAKAFCQWLKNDQRHRLRIGIMRALRREGILP